MRTTRHRKLIKMLFEDLKDEVIPKDYHSLIKIRITDTPFIRGNSSRCKTIYNDKLNNDIYRIIINLDLISLKDTVKNGYTDHYYQTRRNKLFFVIGNRRLAIRFVLLHELRHAYQRIYKVKRDNKYNLNWVLNKVKEIDADDFAISKLKEVL